MPADRVEKEQRLMELQNKAREIAGAYAGKGRILPLAPDDELFVIPSDEDGILSLVVNPHYFINTVLGRKFFPDEEAPITMVFFYPDQEEVIDKCAIQGILNTNVVTIRTKRTARRALAFPLADDGEDKKVRIVTLDDRDLPYAYAHVHLGDAADVLEGVSEIVLNLEGFVEKVDEMEQEHRPSGSSGPASRRKIELRLPASSSQKEQEPRTPQDKATRRELRFIYQWSLQRLEVRDDNEGSECNKMSGQFFADEPAVTLDTFWTTEYVEPAPEDPMDGRQVQAVDRDQVRVADALDLASGALQGIATRIRTLPR